jgi:hypothetical protein
VKQLVSTEPVLKYCDVNGEVTASQVDLGAIFKNLTQVYYQFMVLGPDVVISDYGPQSKSVQFHTFACEWEFED